MIACQRDLFDLPMDVAYFNCAYTAPLMKSAQAAAQKAVGAKVHPWTLTANDFFETLEKNRTLFAKLIGGSANDVAIIPAVSYGLSLAARNIPVAEGQHILVLADQFPSNVYVWQRLTQEQNANVKTVERPTDKDWTAAILAQLDTTTAIAALPACHWTDGTRVDLNAIGEECRKNGTALVVDGTQSLGAQPFSVAQVRPDFLVTTAHKWLLGPYSYGFCYVAPQWQEGRPLEENWLNRAESQDFARLVDYQPRYQAGARRFDVGEASNFILAPIATAALEQIIAWGVSNIETTLFRTTDRIADAATTAGLQVSKASYRAAHILGIQFPQGLPPDLLARLAAQNIYVSVRGNALRIAPHLYNNERDLQRLCDTLNQMA